MCADACDTYQVDLIGAGTVSGPDGADVTMGGRLVWTINGEGTVRVLLYLGDIHTPIICVTAPKKPMDYASRTVATLRAICDGRQNVEV